MNVRRLIFVTHRWSAIVLGVLVFVWFVSGIALAYYPWPLLTESAQRRLLQPFQLTSADTDIIGFRAAARRAREANAPEITGGRLESRTGRLMYELWSDEGGSPIPVALFDARTGAMVTPLSADRAVAFARGLIRGGRNGGDNRGDNGGRDSGRNGGHDDGRDGGRNGDGAGGARVDLLPTGDQYMLSHEYQRFFPAYRVRFNDAAGTAVYVSRDRGNVFGVVTNRTRWLTWLGVVPHWLYFPWLYHRAELWTWLNILLPSAAVLIALTGIVWGVTQLLPLRGGGNGQWRRSPFRGVSQWHHLAGIFFGVLVLTWTVTGVLEMFGSDNVVRPGQAERLRGGPMAWPAVEVREPLALYMAKPMLGLSALSPELPPVLSFTLAQLQGVPGYDVLLANGQEVWIEAASGETRKELANTDAALAALALMPRAAVTNVDRLTRGGGDNYYYARPGREVHFPVWRVVFNDAQRSRVYLNSFTGVPVGFVDRETRAWRWWRDAMHSWDFPALNGRRPLWDIIVMTLLIGGVVSSGTGLWLAVRRLRRIAVASR